MLQQLAGLTLAHDYVDSIKSKKMVN
jgi:hypothetical protein